MHQHAKYDSLGWVLLALALFALSAVGCREEPQARSSKGDVQQTPYHIPVSTKTVAVAEITRRGAARIIAVDENGKAVKPATCQLDGPDKCPFEFPKVVTTIRIGKVTQEPIAKAEGGYGVAFAADGNRKCIFSIAVDNTVYYYVKPCTP